MGYGLWALRLSVPWRLGDAGARCVCLLDRVSMGLAVRIGCRARPLILCRCVNHGENA